MKKYRTWLSGFVLALVWSVALSFPIEPELVAATHAETCIHGWLVSDSGQLKEPLRLERLLAARGALGAHPDLLQNMLGPRGCYSKAKEQGFAKAHHNLGVVYGSALGLGRNQDGAINQPAAHHTGGRQLGGYNRTSSVVVRQELSSEQYEATSIGTAWPIASGYVVTNNHVVSQSNDVLVITASGQQIRAWAVIRDEASDIALLEVSDSHKLPPALPLATSRAKLGASVFTIGFPRIDVMGSTPKLSDGVISDVNGLHGDPGSYQTTVPIQPGNSGGPLLNMRGEVVGVVRSMLGISDETHEKIFVLQNASCARKIEFVKELSALLPRHDPVIKALPSHPDSLETLAERVQGSVLIIIAQ
jgi:S1-C subfamily serine protease